MSGYVGDLTSRQEEALIKVSSSVQPLQAQLEFMLLCHGSYFTILQLREAVADIRDDLPEKDDYFYLRWLRGMSRLLTSTTQTICLVDHTQPASLKLKKQNNPSET